MSQSSIQEKFSPPVAFSPANFAVGGPPNAAPLQLSQSPTEGSIQSLNEGSTQNSTKNSTQTPKETITQNITKASIQSPTERSTQSSTKVSTQASTNSSPQIPINVSTQSLTELITQSPTKGSTQSSKNNTNNKQPSQDQLSQSCLKVSIFYSELSYTLIEEIPSNNILDLAGSIGIFDILL